jgi:flagellar L-ring protein precursor FlgH
MTKITSIFLLVSFVLLGVTGCAVTPPTITHQPQSVQPPSAKPQREPNGAIFQTASYRPLLEDPKARLVGDLLTVTISERTSAAKNGASSGSKTGAAAFSAPSFLGLPASTLARTSISTTTTNSFDETAAATASNTFTGTISVTVVDVLANGNLLVSGEKQIAFDKGAEYVRFSGVVNPGTIGPGNQVASTQIADARFEYRSTSHVDVAEANSILTRFFLSFLPL